MAEISEVHEKVLAFLLDWRAKRDQSLLFTLRKRPIDRLRKGYWFLGNENYLAFSFWTGLDWINKTQNIYLEISYDGFFRVRFSAKDDHKKAEVLKYAAEVLGGFSKSKYKGYGGNVWTKEFAGNDYLSNLQYFLEEDKPRIDRILTKELENQGHQAFHGAFLPLAKATFTVALEAVEAIRSHHDSHPTSLTARREVSVSKLMVKNVGMFEECGLSFGSRATALIGENGSGKTTLLRALALGMAGTGSPLIEVDGFELQTLPRIVSVTEEGKVGYAGLGSIQVEYAYDEQQFHNGKANQISFSMPDDTGKIRFTDRIDHEGYGLPANESDGDGKLPYLLVGYPQRYGENKDPVNIRRKSTEPNAYDILPLILNVTDQRLLSLKRWVSENWNTNEAGKRKVADAFALISQVLNGDEGSQGFSMEVITAPLPERIIVRTPANPKGILLELLSTGLSNLLGWLGHLISRMHEAYPHAANPLHEPSIVLIDEIDNYLHPEVQVRLMKILLENFPKTQFILTAHSPFILTSLPSQEAMAYRIEAGKAEPIRHFYGQSLQNIAYAQFGIEKRPVEIQEKIDEMTWAFALEEIEKARAIFDELQPILGEEDPAIIDARKDLESQEISNAPH